MNEQEKERKKNRKTDEAVWTKMNEQEKERKKKRKTDEAVWTKMNEQEKERKKKRKTDKAFTDHSHGPGNEQLSLQPFSLGPDPW